jgi:excisionase family DNA binding protein
MTTKQAAETLGVNDSRVRQMIREEGLPATKAGRDWLIRRSDLTRYIAAHRLAPRTGRGRPPKQPKQ